ncbi:MAG: hypothetical protein JWN15_482 [Firmicutes bacterium]|nr:hypothetical protein [Bacillota bacterium]
MRTTLVWTVLAILLATVTGCSSKPPDARITAGNVVVPAILGTYCWTTVCADYPVPPRHLQTGQYQTVHVPGGATLAITFTSRPENGTITINQWVGDTATTISGSDKSAIVVPGEPGIYTYDVSARWKRGSASYAFQVEVR